jgi:hypothetical protein
VHCGRVSFVFVRCGGAPWSWVVVVRRLWCVACGASSVVSRTVAGLPIGEG